MNRLAIAVVILCGCNASPSTQTEISTESTPQPVAASAGPAIRISAEDLNAHYRANPAEADKRYNGKRLIVSGDFTGVHQDSMGRHCVRVDIARTDRFNWTTYKHVYFFIPANRIQSFPVKYSPGITVSAVCLGMPFDSVELDDAYLEPKQ